MAAAFGLDVISSRTGLPLELHTFPIGTFVVCEPGTPFTLALHNSSAHHSNVRILIDGSWTGSLMTVKAGDTRQLQGWSLDRHRKSEFVFMSPPTHDSDLDGESAQQAASSSAASAAQLSQLGTIRATFHPVKYMGRKGKPLTARAPLNHKQLSVPEGKKALSLGVTAGHGAQIIHKKRFSTGYHTDKSKPALGVAELRYCVPDALCLSADPALKAVGEALVALQAPPGQQAPAGQRAPPGQQAPLALLPPAGRADPTTEAAVVAQPERGGSSAERKSPVFIDLCADDDDE